MITLNNSSDSVYTFEQVRLVAGISYTIFGIFGALVVGLVICSMQLVKGSRQGNNFYHLSSWCLICDLLFVSIFGIYFGVLITLKHLTTFTIAGQDFFSSFFSFLWPCKGIFLNLVAWTRLRAVKSTVILQNHTTKLMKSMSISLILQVFIGASIMANSDCMAILFSFDQLTVMLNQNVDLCPQIMVSTCNFLDTANCLALILINSVTVILYMKKRVVPQYNLQTAARLVRERKLFLQCAVSAFFYIFGSVVFVVTGLLNGIVSPAYHVVMYMMIMLVYFDTSVAYLAMNQELQQEMRNFSVKKLVKVYTEPQLPLNSNGWLSGL